MHPGLTVVERAFYILIPPINLYASNADERAFSARRLLNTQHMSQSIPALSSAKISAETYRAEAVSNDGLL